MDRRVVKYSQQKIIRSFMQCETRLPKFAVLGHLQDTYNDA